MTRHIFLDKFNMSSLIRIVLIIIISTSITVLIKITEIFYPEVGLLITPISLLIYVLGLSAIIILPLILYRKIRGKFISKSLTYFTAVSLGFFITSIILKPIDKWDSEQRNVSGQIIDSALDSYKKDKGHYPEYFKQLNLDSLDRLLPRNYKSKRFFYIYKNGEFDLDIPLFMDQWHWDIIRKEFVYADF